MVKFTDSTDLTSIIATLLTSYAVFLTGQKELSKLISSFHIEVLQSTSLLEAFTMNTEITNLLVYVTSKL